MRSLASPKWIICLGVIMLGSSHTDGSEPVPVVTLPEMVVTPTRSLGAEVEMPFSVDVVSGHQLQVDRPVPNVPEALNELTSVMVQKTAHGQGSPYLRGFTGFRTLFLIDGIRLNNSTFREGPNQYWATVDPYSLDRLEIVRGPGSVLYGSDAVGGTVQAVTLPGHATWGARWQYRYASAEHSHIGRADGGGPLATVRTRAGVTIKHFGDLEAGNPTDRQPRTGYDEWAADAKFEQPLGADAKLVVAAQHVVQDDVWRTHRTIFAKSFKGTTVGTDRVHVFDQQRDLVYVQLHLTNLPHAVETVRANISYQFQGEELTRVRSNLVREESAVDVHTVGFWLVAESPTPWGRWTYGVDYYRDWVQSAAATIATNGTVTRAIQGPVGDEASYDLLGMFVQNEVPLTERIDWMFGGRYTYARAEADRVRDPISGLATRVEDEWHAVVGQTRWLWRVDEDGRWRLWTGLAQSFRAPNLSDLTRLDIARSGEIETAAPGLKPEEFLSWEVGLRHTGSRWQTELVYFRTEIDNLIVRQPTGNIVNGANEVTKRNSGQGFVHGVEWEGRWEWTPGWSVRGWLTWMEGEVDGYPTSAPVRRREPLSRVMPLTGGLGLRWDEVRRRAWAEVVTVLADRQDRLSAGDRADTQRIPPGGTPGYGVVHVRGGWRINEQVTVSLGVENLLDKNYRVHGSGVNAPGRNAIVSVSVRL